MADSSLLHITNTNEELCILCMRPVLKNDKSSANLKSSWPALKEKAETWSTIDIPITDANYEFRNVQKRLEKVEPGFGLKHEKCRVTFCLQVSRYQKKYGKAIVTLPGTEEKITETTEKPLSETIRTRSTSNHIRSFARKCFICEQGDGRKGKLRRCERETACNHILTATENHSKDTNHRFYSAATRLNLQLSGQSHDLYSADIYYHVSCYSLYIRLPSTSDGDSFDPVMEQYVLNDFFTSIRLNIIRDKNAYLLTQLLTDWLRLCDEKGVETRITRSNQIRKRLEDEFPEEINFFKDGRSVIVYSATVEAVEYSVAALKGEGLRDIDLAKAFAKMVRKKISLQDKVNDFPYTPDLLTQSLQSGPMTDLFNVIYLRIKDRYSLHTHGYAKTESEGLATKMWSLAYDWQALLTERPNPKQVALGMTIHRVSASKEIIDYLHKSNHCISYNQILSQNKQWERMLLSGYINCTDICKGEVTHTSIDNNDGRQQTVTGFGTTHHTNSLLFQPTFQAPKSDNTSENNFANMAIIESSHPGLKEVAPFSLKEKDRKPPPSFPNHVDVESVQLLEKRFECDLIWSIAGGITEESDKTLPLLGSWTSFNIKVSNVCLPQSVKQYLPVVPKPPDYDVLKSYLEFLIETTDNLELKHIFVHADEAVYSKLLHIIWAYDDHFKKVLPLMGSFHQLLLMLQLIYKRHGVIGYKKWFKDAGVIASGSIDKAIEGRHYYRCVRLHKEAFDAIVQLQVEKATDNFKSMDRNLLSKFLSLRQNPCNLTMNEILNNNAFKAIKKTILQTSGTQSCMSLAYLKDVSLLLSLITAARESDIEMHLEAERQILKLIFAFDHVHYSRYNSYQHLLLSREKRENSQVYQDLKNNGISAALTSGTFKGISGDLMTEIFNRETKGTAGPFRSGYSTTMSTVNTWVRTTHIHTKLRVALKEKLRALTSSTHKELTNGHMKRHMHHVVMLKATLKTYQVDFFSTGPAISIDTGEEIKTDIIDDVLNADVKGNTRYKHFINERFVNGTKTIFDPIPRMKLKTGLIKPKRKPKEVSFLREDTQAFGVLVEKACSLEEAFQYPLTSIPLSIAESSVELYSSDKAGLRNWIIRESNATAKQYPMEAGWIVDGMGIVRSTPPESTYGEFFQNLLKRMMPPQTCRPTQLTIVMDTYLVHSAKESTRHKRGEKSARIHISGFGQHMPKSEGWTELLTNSENKSDLISLFVEYLKQPFVREQFKIPIVVTEGENTWEITKTEVKMLFKCNHEEADTRMVLHALLGKEHDWVICTKDTDVLLLMSFAYSENDISKNWYMMYEVGLFARINDIVEYLGDDVCKVLPQYHTLTGCDTTSYYFNVGKMKPFKKMLQTRASLALISQLGQETVLSGEDISNCMKFIQTIMYTGNAKEDYVQTRIRLYKKQKRKLSRPLPPDPNSCHYAILRAHHQAFQYVRVSKKIIENISLKENGWGINEEGVTPIWYTCPRFPPSAMSKPKRKKLSKDINKEDGNEADDETISEPPLKKKVRRETVTTKNSFKLLCTEVDMNYDADSDSSAELNEDDSDWEHFSEFSDSNEESDSDSDYY